MDRGWHDTTCSGPERPRLGQQPYDRGRVVPNDRRSCFQCGQEGHISRNCPSLNVRGYDSGRYMDRSAGGSYGRWSQDYWPASRSTAFFSKEHTHSRGESTRESGSSGRRSQFDHHDHSDCLARPRDAGDKSRDHTSRCSDVVSASNATVRERESKSSRSSARKPSDEMHQATGGHRRDEQKCSREDTGKAEVESTTLKVVPKIEARVGDRLTDVVGDKDVEDPQAGHDEKLTSKSRHSDLELVTSNIVPTGVGASAGPGLDHHIPESGKNVQGGVPDAENCRHSEKVGKGELKCSGDQFSRSKDMSSRRGNSKLPLSVLCKAYEHAAEANLERKLRTDYSHLNTASCSSLSAVPVLSSLEEEKEVEEIPCERQSTIVDSLPLSEDIKGDDKSEKSQSCETEHRIDKDCQREKQSSQDKGALIENIVSAALKRPTCDEDQCKPGKGKRMSRWDTGREQDYGRNSVKDELKLVPCRDAISDPSQVSEKLPMVSGRAAVEQGGDKQRIEGETDHDVEREPGTDFSDGERYGLSQQPDNGSSVGVKRQGAFRERYNDPDRRVREDEFDCHGRGEELDRRAVASDKSAEKDSCKKPSENTSVSPLKRRNASRERDGTHESYNSLGSREVSVDMSSDRNGHPRYYERTGLKNGYRRCYDTIGGRNGYGNSEDADLHRGGDARERRVRVSDSRQLKIWETQPGGLHYRPGSYVSVCNARFLQQKSPSPMAISPPSSQAAVSHDQYLPSGLTEEVNCSARESKSRGWMYNDNDDKLQGALDSRNLQSDQLVLREGTTEWVILEHAGSPVTSNFVPSSPGAKGVPTVISSELAKPSTEVHSTVAQELSKRLCKNEHADQDICPPGTEVPVSVSCEDLHIDERVEKLMQGITLIPGKEREIVYEALSTAARRVLQDYETDMAIEESPRSHGGFADLGDQWKDGDFGSDVQGLDCFVFEQLVPKQDENKVEEVAIEAGVDTVPEVVSAPPVPTYAPPLAENLHVEGRQESWKWPSRGGDWKVVYVIENSQQPRGDVPAAVEKGYPGVPRKVVMNGGHPLCESRNTNPRDPRKQLQDSCKLNVAEWHKLEVPKFVQSVITSKADNVLEDQFHPNQNHVTTPKGVNGSTPKSQASTPVAHLATPVKGRSSTCGSGGALKPVKPSSIPVVVPSTGSKSVGHVMHQNALTKTTRTVIQSSKRELLVVKKNVSVVDKTGLVDGQSKSTEQTSQPFDRRVELVLQDRLVDNPSPRDLRQKVGDPEPSNRSELILVKKSFFNRVLPSKESLALEIGLWYYLDGMGREVGPFSFEQAQSLVVGGKLLEGSSIYRKSDDTWVPVNHPSRHGYKSPTHDLNIASENVLEDFVQSHTTLSIVKELPESSALVQSASKNGSGCSPMKPSTPTVHCAESFVSPHNWKDGSRARNNDIFPDPVSFHDLHPQFMGFTRGKLHEYVMKSYKVSTFSAALYEGLERWFQEKEQKCLVAPSSTASGSPSLMLSTTAAVTIATPTTLDPSAVEKCHANGFSGGMVDDEHSPSKRKAWAVEDGEPSKHYRKSIQRRRLLDSEDSDGDVEPLHAGHTNDSIMPPLVDDNPMNASLMEPLQTPESLETTEENWATLKPSVLRMVLRFLRGEVKSLVNAMATCKSWMVAGMRCKNELKQVDLSSIQGHNLVAVFESLPRFGGGKLRKIILKGCTPVSTESLGNLLRACPSICAVEMGCNEPSKDLIRSFPKVRWVMDHPGVMSPRERLIRKRDESHLKTRSLKVIGESKDGTRESMCRNGEELEVHLMSDTSSKVRSPDGYMCNVNTDVETTTNDSVQDSAITHITRGPNDGIKHLKLNNGGRKIDAQNGYPKAVLKRENGNDISHLHVKHKTLTGSSHRKYEKSVNRRMKPVTGSRRSVADKVSSTTTKAEHHAKSICSGIIEVEKSLEKEIAIVLRAIMDADTNRLFQPINVDGKGFTTVPGRYMDLLMIDKKLKGGLYAGGKDGFRAFKDDVNALTRNAFRSAKDTPVYSTAVKIFKLTHQHFASLESLIASNSPHETQNQSRLFSTRPFNKPDKRGLKHLTSIEPRPGKKRKTWDDDSLQKGKSGLHKKGRQGDWSGGDADSDSESSEQEIRRYSKLKKERSWESDDGESSEEEEDGFVEEDEEETETEASDSDIPSESEGDDGIYEDDNYYSEDELQMGYHEWGARMTKAAMVPPVTRKYVVIEEYRIVADKERVEQKMKVELPKDYLEATKDKGGDHYSHLDVPEIKEYQARKRLGEEVVEQEVYGIDPYTHNLLKDTMPGEFSEVQKEQFIEERVLLALNKEVKQFTGGGRAPMEYPLERVVQRISQEAEMSKDWALYDFSELLLLNMKGRPKDKYVAYRKGLGVVCNKLNGLEKDEFVVEFFGEVYPPWRWYEKQDGIRSLQKKDKDPTPEFYNIYYERPKGDAGGYDLLVVDAMHKANFASRLCHSCRPNCEAKITAVNNTYIIGVYSLKPIKRGEELTFDYNSVTESKEEYNNAVCLCGTQGCRGSYLNLTGSGTFEEVIGKDHGLLERHRLLLDSCNSTSLTDEEWDEMKQAGLGSCLLSGLPDWALKYASRLVHFMNFEKLHLPAELLKDYELKRKQGVVEGCTEVDAEITTEGVYNQRLQNLAITLDKVRHILTELYGKPSLAPPPLCKRDQRDMVLWIWKNDNSVVNELLQCLGLHLPKETLTEFKQDITKNEPHESGSNLRECLLWLRDELRRLPATCKARHDAAADLIHLYAYTKYFFTLEGYGVVKSPEMTITPLDLGSKYSISGSRKWHKVYSKEYVSGQLINWYKQNVSDPGASIAKSRGCLILPDVSSCYAKSMQHDFRQGYGQKHREKMISHMEQKPQQKWPKSKFWSQFWTFKNERGLFGSPMLDSVIENKPLNEEMLQWLKVRENVFVGPWDEQ